MRGGKSQRHLELHVRSYAPRAPFLTDDEPDHLASGPSRVRFVGRGNGLLGRTPGGTTGDEAGGSGPASLGHRKTNVRELGTAFLGRARELVTLEALFGAHDRLVSLIGPAGCGKTRLAKRYAALQVDAFAQGGGAWFCDLTEARSEDEVVASVAHALGIPLERATNTIDAADAVEQVGAVLANSCPVLVVLDNCEQAIDDVARVVTAWRARAPDVHLLTTSRERLRVDGERILELRPLPLPREGEDVSASEAVQLFVDRARLVRPDYAPGGAEIPLVAEIVRALDGLPLAVELAAARMRVMNAGTLLGRLDRRFEVLRDTRRGAPRHHATLRAAIGWSWALLEEWEQGALRQCAGFRGGFSIEAAEAVLDLGAFPGAPSVLDALQALRDKSLVYAEPTDPTGAELRLGLYESVREYAAERLADSGEVESVFARHTAYFLGTAGEWAERAEIGSAEDVRRLGLEIENLRAVHERALARAPRDALLAALILAGLYLQGGSPTVFLSMLDATLHATADATGRRPRHAVRDEISLFARVLVHRAHVLFRLGRCAEGRDDAELARALARQAQDVYVEAQSEHRLGLLESLTSAEPLGEPLRHFEAARAGFHAAQRPGLEAWTLIEIAIMNSKAGRVTAARDLYVEVLAIADAAGAERAAAKARYGLGVTQLELGMLADAERELTEATAAFLRLRDSFQYYLALVYRGFVHHERGDLVGAEAAYREVLSAPMGVYPIDRGLASAALGALLATRGDLTEAARALDDADAELLRFDGEWSVVACVLRGHLDLGLARQALAHAEASGGGAGSAQVQAQRRSADDHRHKAEQRLATGAAWASRSDDVRMALRWLERALQTASSEQSHARDALVVAEDAGWFRLPFGWRVDVGTRPHERALLRALLRMRIEAPGRSLRTAELVEAGWPGERILPRAGAGRVYVAVSTLRQLGLRDLLQSAGGGYLIDPRVPTVVATGASW